MLIRKENLSNNGLMGIWKIEETTDELLKLFPNEIRAEAQNSIADIKSKRRRTELLSTRVMLLELLGEIKTLLNQSDGKPYLSDNSYNISISHTKGYAAILLHKTQPVGIDLETRSERVKKVAYRFISEDEYIDPHQKIVHQLLHWSAKECMFKLINEPGIDFKKQLHLKPFTPDSAGMIEAFETKTEVKKNFKINYEVHPTYVLTWVVDTKNAPENPERI